MPIEVLSYRAHVLLEAPGLNGLAGRDDTRTLQRNACRIRSSPRQECRMPTQVVGDKAFPPDFPLSALATVFLNK